MHAQKMVLVTGATGYIGGRLVPFLLQAGYAVRVLVRDPARLQGRAWVDLVGGRISNGNVALFDLGAGAALRIKLVSGLYLTVEPVRLHILFPFKTWGTGTRALFDLDITARIGFQL